MTLQYLVSSICAAGAEICRQSVASFVPSTMPRRTVNIACPNTVCGERKTKQNGMFLFFF